MLKKASRLRLDPGEAVTDPLMSGAAWVRKNIGGQDYEALVDPRMLGPDREYLQCFPDRNLRRIEGRTIRINGWTRWKMSGEAFSTLEWVKDPPVRPMTEDGTRDSTEPITEADR